MDYEDLKKQYEIALTILDNLPDTVSMKDTDGKFLFMNEIALSGFGGSREALVGKSDFDFLEEETAQQLHELEQQTLESGETYEQEEEPVPNIWVMTTKKPVKNEDGETIGLVCISREITRIKQMESELERQQQIIEAQREAMQEMATFVIPIVKGIVLVPLVGNIDSHRAQDVMRGLLAGITRHRAEILILDITGVAVVDSGVAAHLNKTIQAARLKGAHTIVTGISEAVAETVVDLGIDWSDLDTVADLQTGLKAALDRLGRKL